MKKAHKRHRDGVAEALLWARATACGDADECGEAIFNRGLVGGPPALKQKPDMGVTR